MPRGRVLLTVGTGNLIAVRPNARRATLCAWLAPAEQQCLHAVRLQSAGAGLLHILSAACALTFAGTGPSCARPQANSEIIHHSKPQGYFRISKGALAGSAESLPDREAGQYDAAVRVRAGIVHAARAGEGRRWRGVARRVLQQAGPAAQYRRRQDRVLERQNHSLCQRGPLPGPVLHRSAAHPGPGGRPGSGAAAGCRAWQHAE